MFMEVVDVFDEYPPKRQDGRRGCDETDVVEATQRAAEEEEESCRPGACLVCEDCGLRSCARLCPRDLEAGEDWDVRPWRRGGAT